MAKFPPPPGADKESLKAIEHFEKKFEALIISEAEVKFVLDGIIKAQKPRDEKRRKEQELADRRRSIADANRRYL